MKTEIAKDIEVAEHQIQYDTQCKKCLGTTDIVVDHAGNSIRVFAYVSG